VTSADTTLSGAGTNGKTVVVTVATPGGATKTYETVVTNGKWTVNLEAPLKSGRDPYNKGADETKITVQYKGENNKLNDETRVYLGRPKFVNDTVVAGQKEVLVKVPKDADNLWVGFTGSWDRQVIMNGGNPQSQDTSTLTAAMADTQDDPLFHIVKLTFLQNVIKEGANGINLQAQSGYSAAGGAQPGTTEAAEAKRLSLTATNEAPTIAATNNGSDVVVKKGEAFDIATLATVADKEDDAQLTVGEPVKAKLVSVNGTAATTFSTATPGEYTLVLKAVDSQGKDSANTITRKVIVTDNQAPTVELPYSNADKR
jgi:gram-positive signal peptide, ysirk family protein (fragment)